MFIAPVSNYSYSKQNFRSNNYTTNIDPSYKRDSVSFGNLKTVPIPELEAKLPSIDEVIKLALSVLNLKDGEHFSESQTEEVGNLCKMVMTDIEPPLETGKTLNSDSNKTPYFSYDPASKRLSISIQKPSDNVFIVNDLYKFTFSDNVLTNILVRRFSSDNSYKYRHISNENGVYKAEKLYTIL